MSIPSGTAPVGEMKPCYPKKPPPITRQCRDSAAALNPIAAARLNCSPPAATAAPKHAAFGRLWMERRDRPAR
jgi:hypothetical protein